MFGIWITLVDDPYPYPSVITKFQMHTSIFINCNYIVYFNIPASNIKLWVLNHLPMSQHPTGTYVYFDFFRYNNHTLPSPRAVSVSVLMSAGSRPPRYDPLFTHMVMQWGQFLDHDLDFTTMAPSIQRFSDGLACKETCDHDAPCFPITGKLCVWNPYVDYCIALLLDMKPQNFSLLLDSPDWF